MSGPSVSISLPVVTKTKEERKETRVGKLGSVLAEAPDFPSYHGVSFRLFLGDPNSVVETDLPLTLRGIDSKNLNCAHLDRHGSSRNEERTDVPLHGGI